MDVDEASPSTVKHRPGVLTNCFREVGLSGFLEADSFSSLLAVSKAPSEGFDPCALTLAWRSAAVRSMAAYSLTSRTAIGANGLLALDHLTRIDLVDKVLSLAIVNPHCDAHADFDFELEHYDGDWNDEGEHATTGFMDAWDQERVRGVITGSTALYLFLQEQGRTPSSVPAVVTVTLLMDPVFKHLNGLVEYDARRAGGVKKCRYAGDLTFTRQLVAKGPRWFKDIEVDVFGEKEDPLLQVSVSESHIPDGNGLTGELTKLAAGPVVDALQVVAFYDGGELRFIKTPAFDEAVTALRFVVQPAGVPDPTDVAALRRWGFNDAPMELECADLGKCWKLLPANQKYASGGDLDFWKYHDLATTSAMLCAGRVVPRKEHGRIWRGCLALYARTPGWALRLERTRVGGRPKIELLALTKSIRKQIPKLLDYSRAGVVSGIGGSYALHHLMSENGTSAGWEPNDIDYYHIRHGDAASRLGDSIAAFKAALVADDGPFPGGVTLEMDDVTRLAHLYPPVDNLRPTIVNDFLPKITFLDGVTGGRHQVKMEKISFIEIETGNPANVTLEAILASYDIDVCSVGMRFVDGEWRFVCADDAAAAIEAKTMTVREGRVTKRTMPRVKKYKSRGFSLSEAGTGALTAGVLAL